MAQIRQTIRRANSLDKRKYHRPTKVSTRMVDVGSKAITRREAMASADVHVGRQTLKEIMAGRVPKGDVFAVAQLAGIMAVKNTAHLIPLCHPLPIDGAEVQIVPIPPAKLRITAKVVTIARTGAEMEALAAVSIAALAVYDMCKSMSRSIEICRITLDMKTGGKSGNYLRQKTSPGH